MEELIKVTTNENNEQLVSGRELHEFLEVATEYKKWFSRMAEYGFDENIDFVRVTQKCPTPGGIQNITDHVMKLDMAKEISMIQRTEKGKQARQYFLQVEKAWNSEEMILMRSRQILERKVETLQLENEEMKPKALFADSVSASHTSILVGELAKLINQNGVDIGSKRLFSWLREKGYLIKRKGTDWNMPTQKAMDLGLFEIKETTISHSDGHISINKTPKVTGKGQVYFVNKFLGGAISEKTYFKTID
ncbi:oxidoreductase [Enterococcus durans]|uniref:Oxidoreductase n=2 Tax=Enterococcus durans TaxID=53345 RepID=A0A5N0Z063_9ENTE|nr:phage antirepressor KilAC domain-containing protein [Enterococcus durans]KAA9187884.1 oxidoreductase [Enterococcus durans]KAA9188207.1 oxidoreductase [Enterococcus durans]KAA9191261.1 oxidoreductase [Enterococcus durans]KAA9193895.1 oxidoreductase [Enterococcus durans]KAA9198212.1 oxidoreductase [Enterococcus durans]